MAVSVPTLLSPLLLLLATTAFRDASAQQLLGLLVDYAAYADLLSDSDVDLLGADDLNALCIAGCRSSLVSIRSQIASACNANTDDVVTGNIAYPGISLLFMTAGNKATYFVDRFLFAYDVSCHVDGSVTASCGAAGYHFTTPGAYGSTISATTGTATGSAAPLPLVATCIQTYAVAAGDTCKSISQAQGVSTYGLISCNGLDLFCSQLPSGGGQQLCLPGACQTHKWTGVDSCESVTQHYNVSMANFLSWNPIFDPYCTNAGPRWTDWTVCISLSRMPLFTWADSLYQSTRRSSASSFRTHGSPHSAKRQGGLDARLHPSNGTLPPRRKLLHHHPAWLLHHICPIPHHNPSIDEDCTNLWLGYAYCVRPVDNAVEVPASTTFTRPPAYTPPPPPPVISVPATTSTSSTLPHAPSSAPSCTACVSVAFSNQVLLKLFLVWNPSLQRGPDCTLSPGLSYCIGVEGGGLSTVIDISEPPTSSSSGGGGGGVSPPAPTRPGSIETCRLYHEVVSGDGCCAISQQYGISLDDFYLWNPGVGTDCGALWLGYAVCVGI
ncbi:hypothetical protein B0H66DRAFT_617709 [Apodospora peruviana]|uniref:LysM domain-containing protein n=1 Tax=Apodospora peruviana TaxID=516989 RepID=A0AAE0IKH3_9PEZI|nr:hypothetical protein B0H66DRAFT_617709 [Apodospora peruviana]